MAQRMVDVEQLTPEQQLELIGELWDNLSRNPEHVPLTDTQRAEIDRRCDDLDEDVRAGRPLGIPWEDVLHRLRNRF
jgi:putative addiction module component (TIGR02574 family)